MNLDVRLPMGLLFAIIGIILLVHGFTADQAIYDNHSLGININARWGGVILAFGAFMLFLSRKKKS
ncbi:MAG: hypothetical protein IPP19_05345 [Verrucomicrobia bacterium]|nr:hypothetical protein [Verrucomicrobiota bacterium]